MKFTVTIKRDNVFLFVASFGVTSIFSLYCYDLTQGLTFLQCARFYGAVFLVSLVTYVSMLLSGKDKVRFGKVWKKEIEDSKIETGEWK